MKTALVLLVFTQLLGSSLAVAGDKNCSKPGAASTTGTDQAELRNMLGRLAERVRQQGYSGGGLRSRSTDPIDRALTRIENRLGITPAPTTRSGNQERNFAPFIPLLITLAQEVLGIGQQPGTNDEKFDAILAKVLDVLSKNPQLFNPGSTSSSSSGETSALSTEEAVVQGIEKLIAEKQKKAAAEKKLTESLKKLLATYEDDSDGDDTVEGADRANQR